MGKGNDTPFFHQEDQEGIHNAHGRKIQVFVETIEKGRDDGRQTGDKSVPGTCKRCSGQGSPPAVSTTDNV